MERPEIEYLRSKARQFRLIAASHETGISAKLLEIAAELEAYARKIDRQRAADQRDEEIVRLRLQARDAVRLASERAQAGEGTTVSKLIEFAAELQVKSDVLSAEPQQAVNDQARRIRQLRMRAEETRAIAEGILNISARESLSVAADSYEQIAASLERNGSGL